MFETLPDKFARELEHLLDTQIIRNIPALTIAFTTPNNGGGKYKDYWCRWRRSPGGWRVEAAMKPSKRWKALQ